MNASNKCSLCGNFCSGIKIGVTQNQNVSSNAKKLRRISQIDLQAGHNPADTYGEEPEQDDIDEQYREDRAQLAEQDGGGSDANGECRSAWLTSEERNIETGTTSAGKTVLVIRLACSSREVDERCTVSLNSSQGSMPAKRNSG